MLVCLCWGGAVGREGKGLRAIGRGLIGRGPGMLVCMRVQGGELRGQGKPPCMQLVLEPHCFTSLFLL